MGHLARLQLSLLLLAVLLVSSTACGALSDDPLGEMKVRAVSGTVEVLRGNEEPIVVEDEFDLEPADIVRTKKGALASLRLEGERRLKLQGGTEVRIKTGSSVETRKGSLLADTEAFTKVVFDGIEASGSDSMFRIDRGFGSSRAAGYDGSFELFVPGEPTLKVARLFEATVAANDLPNDDEPYRLDEKDVWDVNYLRDILDLEEDLSELARGFSQQLTSSRPGLDYFSDLAGGGNVSFMSRYLDRRPIDLLIGFTIADSARGKSLGSAFADAFGLYDDGASWGVTAGILEVRPAPLLAALDDVVLATGVVAEGGEGSDPEFVVASGESGGTDAPISSGGTGDEPETISGGIDPNDGGGDGGRGGDGDGDGGNDEEEEECSSPNECAENEIRKIISPSPSPSDVLDGVIRD